MLKKLNVVSQLRELFWRYVGTYSELPKESFYLIFVSFINSLAAGTCFFLSFYFVMYLNFNIATAGAILSFYGVGRVLGGFFGGRLSDKLNAEVISTLSLIGQATSLIMIVYAENFSLLCIILLLFGIFAYMFKVSNTLSVLSFCQKSAKQKLQAINILYVSSNIGVGVSSLIIALFGRHEFYLVFIINAILLLLAAMSMILYSYFHKRSNVDLIKNNLDTTCNVEAQYTNKRPNTIDKRVLLHGILISIFLIGFIVSQRQTTYSIYLHSVFPDFGLMGIAILFALNPLLIILFQNPLVGYLRRYNHILMTGMGAFLMGLGMLILVLTTSFSLAILSCIVYTVGEMIFFPLSELICYQITTPESRGKIIGNYESCFALGVVFGPLLGGVIYHYYGGEILWYCSGLIGIMCLCGFCVLRERN